jgi:hypothetical protein
MFGQWVLRTGRLLPRRLAGFEPAAICAEQTASAPSVTQIFGGAAWHRRVDIRKVGRAAPLCPTHEREHDADNYDDHCQPNEQVSPAHGGAGHAAKSEQRRHQGDNDQDKRIVDKVSGHISKSPGPDG